VFTEISVIQNDLWTELFIKPQCLIFTVFIISLLGKGSHSSFLLFLSQVLFYQTPSIVASFPFSLERL